MIGRIFSVALLAGLLAGLAISVVQEFTTTPIILHAEQYEGQGGHVRLDLEQRGLSGPRLYLAHGQENHAAGAHAADGDQAWAPEDGLERTLFTTLANVLTAIGYAMILAAAMYSRGKSVDGRQGVLWGVAGFTALALAPALGLPPEVPGSMAAEVPLRQAWWAFAAGSTGAGLWLMAFGKARWLPLLGLVLLVLPHARA